MSAVSQTWEWRFQHPPAAMWPLLADTARFNEAARLPKHQITEILQADGSVHYLADAKIGPFGIKWQEKPVNWVSEQWFEHTRYFRNGPLKVLSAELQIEPEGSGSRAHYSVTIEPANLLGKLMVGRMLASTKATFGRLADEAAAYVAGQRSEPFPYAAPQVSDEVRQRVDRMVAEIEATPNGHGLARQLADHILNAQEVDLWRVRPLALARLWNCPPRHAIELCLQAVRAGLLQLRWDLLCPRCRVAKGWSGGLDHLPQGAHCSSCNIDYERDFSRNVEASFHPAPSVRVLESGEYCMWGPMSVPHVKAQVLLQPGETRELKATLPFGPYRFRTLEPGPEADVDWRSGGLPELILEDKQVAIGAAAAPGLLRLTNHAQRPLIAIIEDRSWVADALTADRVTAVQTFRDLFSDDVLRPGDEVAVGRIALLFSDLKGSTALYQSIGDASAYHLVRDHFAFMAKVIREHEGAIVKTIGDAVMAAFVSPGQAVAAAIDIQRRVAAFNRENHMAGGAASPPIVIKLGVHSGPTIAVTLNDRLDYFGSTVNMAARLQGQSEGGEIVLSAEIAEDSAVAPLLADLPMLPDQANLKGFGQPIRFFRLGPSL
ncbi:adenylate/guanylate cyclase domain-containing protein [Dongia deserti]|uniref:adenylate/guanylate cyclase domain-containing protein n=1 Tax=Dongia deserti TaxID=2268030 RepID=UPI000E64C30B|nr:adenylate/guanylate cyclase domain-containing protein [Dongia deserti]